MTPELLNDTLEKMFHEPNRLSIMTELCAENAGVSFGELKQRCNLTDGNLNRHLKVLEECGAVKITKEFIDNKPRTTIFITKTGFLRFNDYLQALSDVLNKARKAMPKENKAGVRMFKVIKATV